MTNYEKNKELLDMYAVADVPWGVDADGKVFECDFCNHCIFREDGHCTQKRLQWLQQEYKEPEVDWYKVNVDTPILVKDLKNGVWHRKCFAGCIGGKVCAFDDGKTSKNFGYIIPWKYAKLAEQENKV